MNLQPIQIPLSPGLAKDSRRAEDFDAVTVNMAMISRASSDVMGLGMWRVTTLKNSPSTCTDSTRVSRSMLQTLTIMCLKRIGLCNPVNGYKRNIIFEASRFRF